MIDLSALQQQLIRNGQPEWADTLTALPAALNNRLKNRRVDEWQAHLDALSPFSANRSLLNSDTVTFEAQHELNTDEHSQLRETLLAFSPWRKGPFNILGIDIDTEWRSDWKWRRVESANIDLRERRVLDVGCGSGYHCLRMLGAGAKSVIGIEPTLLYVAQFLALNHFAQQEYTCVLPFALEDLGNEVRPFNTVFSMGVLYHRRSPIDHLLKLHELIEPGGELILETLVVTDRELLLPAGRYAQMRNVWFIPSPEQLISWLERCGFQQCEVLDISQTSTNEQRRTDWMTFDSLPQFLDPKDNRKTIEGYPAPVRALLRAIA